MEYKYHAQRQAEDFARQIIPVTKEYPLKAGLPERYGEAFAWLCELARKIYL